MGNAVFLLSSIFHYLKNAEYDSHGILLAQMKTDITWSLWYAEPMDLKKRKRQRTSGIATWSSGKLPVECKEIAKNLTLKKCQKMSLFKKKPMEFFLKKMTSFGN